jgi:hypothetical protein
MAVTEGLRVPKSPPDWVNCLSGLHDSPYFLRYSTGVHGIVSPNAQIMAAGLAELLEVVQKQIR